LIGEEGPTGFLTARTGPVSATAVVEDTVALIESLPEGAGDDVALLALSVPSADAAGDSHTATSTAHTIAPSARCRRADRDRLRLTAQHTDGDLALAHVAGELDVATAPDLRAQDLALIEQGHRHRILNRQAVTFCDSSGFNALVGIFRCAKAADGSVSLSAVPDRLERLLKLTGLDALLPAQPTAADALTAHTRCQDTADA
jgi:anti-sigma B factor antagonist